MRRRPSLDDVLLAAGLATAASVVLLCAGALLAVLHLTT